MILTKNEKYDTSDLVFLGWSTGEVDILGYSCWDWFRDGIYLGADADGIFPIFGATE